MKPTVELPEIPKGLATQIGQIVGAAFALIALVTAVLDGDHSQETVTALILSAVTFITLMAGRFAQAYAMLRERPSPVAVVPLVEASGAEEATVTVTVDGET
jgi:hypothetical protein